MATTSISQEIELQAELASLTPYTVLIERVSQILQKGKAHPGASKHHSRDTKGSQDSTRSGQKREWCFLVWPSSRSIISFNRLTPCVTGLFSLTSPLKKLSTLILCIPSTALHSNLRCTGHSRVLPEHLFPANLQHWWNSDEPALFKDLKIAKSFLCPCTTSLHLGPPSPLSCTLTPQSLTQSGGDWHLPFWTHYSSAIPKATERFHSAESYT